MREKLSEKAAFAKAVKGFAAEVAQVVSEAKSDQERVLKHRTTLRRQRTALEEGARDMQREVEEGLDATKGLTDDDAARTDSVDRVKFGDFCGRYP